MIVSSLILLLEASEIFLEYPHGFTEGIVVLIWIINDFEKGFDDSEHLVELLIVELALFVEVMGWLLTVFHIHGDSALLVL